MIKPKEAFLEGRIFFS